MLENLSRSTGQEKFILPIASLPVISGMGENNLHDINSAKLLHEHDEIRVSSSTPISPNGEEFLPAMAAPCLTLDLEKLVGIVHVSRGLDRVATQPLD